MTKRPNTNSGAGADAVCEDTGDGGVTGEKENVGGVKIVGGTGPGLWSGAALDSGRPNRFGACRGWD